MSNCTECKHNPAAKRAWCEKCGRTYLYCGLHQFRDCQTCRKELEYLPKCDEPNGKCFKPLKQLVHCTYCGQAYQFCAFHGLRQCVCRIVSKGKSDSKTRSTHEGQLNPAKKVKKLGSPVTTSQNQPVIPFVDRILDPDESDSDFEPQDPREFKITKVTSRRKVKLTPPEFDTSHMFKPKTKKGNISTTTKGKLEARDKLSVVKGYLQRPTDYGPVTITKEEIDLPFGQQKLQRTVKVAGLVYLTTTSGRPSAPEPSSGLKVGNSRKSVGDQSTRNTGIVDAQKGHIMALELGGPDIEDNIVPQWANWQAIGAWRNAEKHVLVLAQKAEEKGRKLWFEATLRYKPYQRPELGTFKGLTFPMAFRIRVYECKGKTKMGAETIVFDNEQTQDETDFKVSGRIFDEVDRLSPVESDDESMAD